MGEELLLVVSVVDLAYTRPSTKIVYAGSDMRKAYSIYNKKVSASERTRVTLDLVQGSESNRIKVYTDELMVD